MKKIVLLSLALAALALAACSGGGGGKIDVGVAIPETHVERWVRDGAELVSNLQALGYKAEAAYGDADQTKQNKQIEDFITKGAKLIIIGSVNEGAAEAVEKASKEGVKVIAYDRLITGSDKYDYYITFDNFAVGQFQGKAIADGLKLETEKGPFNITLFAGAATDNNAKYFFDGAMQVLGPYVKAGKLKIVGPAPMVSSDADFTKITTENWMPEKAKARMENLLTGDAAKVKLDAVLAPNDTLARAIIEALSADQKYSKTLPLVTGQDGEIASVKMIRDGKQYMTVFKDTRALAKSAAMLAKEILTGTNPAIDGARLDTTSYNTGKKTVNSYLLAPVNVTKDNFKAVFVDSGYYKEDDLK